MTTTPQAHANFQNSILAVARLREIQRENLSQEALRQDTIAERKRKAQETERTLRAQEFDTRTEEAFGQKPSASLRPFTAQARALSEPGAFATAPLASTTSTGPSALVGNIPFAGNIVNRPANKDDVRGALSRGAEEYRNKELIPEGYAQGLGEARLARLRSTRILPSLEDVPKKEQSYNETRKGQLEVEKREREEREGVIMQGARIRKNEAEAKKAESEAITSNVEARYAEQAKQAALRIQELDEQIKKGQVDMLPEQLAKLRDERKTAELQRQRTEFELAQARTLARLRNEYAKVVGTPAEDEYLKRLAVASGHEVGALTENRAVRKEIVDLLSDKIPQMMVTARKAVTDGQPDLAESIIQKVNQATIIASRPLGSTRVQIHSLGQTQSGLMSRTPSIGQATVPADVAARYVNGELEAMARGRIPMTPQAQSQAMLQYVAIRNSYAGLDQRVYAEAITNLNADPLATDLALKALGPALAAADVRSRGAADAGASSGEFKGGIARPETPEEERERTKAVRARLRPAPAESSFGVGVSP